jgi:uncharacterized protein YdeI (YjbR/CyaY-like superfamily)
MKPRRPAPDLPIRLFKDEQAWAEWLEKHHRSSTGIWLRLAKKGSALRSISYAEALDCALGYGWIDGQKKPESNDTWLQKFVPRSSRSIWSKINRENAVKLIASGRIKAAGLMAIERAKKTGRWETAYDSPSRATVPPDFQRALEATPSARMFFESLESRNRYAILFRIQTVKKAETRARKIEQFIAMLERREKFHP